MLKEHYTHNGQEMSMNALNVTDKESMNKSFIGEFQDTIFHANGKVEVRPVDRNIIVNDIGKLIACLFKSQSGYSGIGYWAIGSGAENWDNINPTPALATDTKCVNEIGRKAIPSSSITFVDGAGADTTTVTNKIRITVTFTETECNGTWREFVIFGGNATTTRDSGIAINHKNHGMIVKTNQMVIQRQIIFTFN